MTESRMSAKVGMYSGYVVSFYKFGVIFVFIFALPRDCLGIKSRELHGCDAIASTRQNDPKNHEIGPCHILWHWNPRGSQFFIFHEPTLIIRLHFSKIPYFLHFLPAITIPTCSTWKVKDRLRQFKIMRFSVDLISGSRGFPLLRISASASALSLICCTWLWASSLFWIIYFLRVSPFSVLVTEKKQICKFRAVLFYVTIGGSFVASRISAIYPLCDTKKTCHFKILQKNFLFAGKRGGKRFLLSKKIWTFSSGSSLSLLIVRSFIHRGRSRKGGSICL